MNNLVVDIGNSVAKVAFTQNGVIVAEYAFEAFTVGTLQDLLYGHKDIDAAILSTTRKSDAEVEKSLRATVGQTILFDHTTPVPIKNLYKTPQTLGMDRLAAAIGAWSQVRDQELLIFDFGTAITIDRVTARGEYLGGNISPGMKMRFDALAHFTGKLPLVRWEDGHREDRNAIGGTTVEAIWNGVVQGIENEIEGYIKHNDQAKIFFTGGDAKYFVKCRENAIFADYQLVIKGLERTIEYNAKKFNY